MTRRMVGHLRDAAETLRGCGLRFPVIHGPKRVGAALPANEAISQLDETARFATEIGATVVVLHLWDLTESDADFAGRLEAVVVAADVVAKHGVTLAVETIPCHFSTPLRNIERVLEHESRVSVALDTEFLSVHGEMEAALVADWLWSQGRVRHVHLKDYDGSLYGPDGARRYLLPGEGSIDFGDTFDALERRGFSGTVSLEAAAYLGDGQPDLDALCRVVGRMSHAPWRFV